MTARTLFGRRNDGSYGLDVSVPGHNVLTAPDSRLAFSTRWSHAASIHQTGTIKASEAGTVVHFPPLPYVPMVMALVVHNGEVMPVRPEIIMEEDGDGYPWVASSGLAPFYTVTKSSLTMRTLPSHYIPENMYAGWIVERSPKEYTARYAVFRIPGGA